MRVLAVNKFYYAAGGAETVFLKTNALLEDAGHEIVPFATSDRRNDPTPWSAYFAPARNYDAPSLVSRTRAGFAAIYSVAARRAARRLISELQPDIAHLHNIYHQLSLSVIDELKAARIPTVMTIHDYKPVCPAYLLLTGAGERCQRCVEGSPVNAIVHRCVKQSRAASAVAAVEAYLARFRRQYEKVDRLIVPSRFVGDVLIRGGISSHRIHVLPNFADPPASVVSDRDVAPTFLFAGRLSREKGLHDLLTAASSFQRGRLRIAGTGPLEPQLRDRVRRERLPVELLGRLSRNELDVETARAWAVVLPAVWYENCPMALIEAAARGVPAVATRLGGIPEIVEDGASGVLVNPSRPDELAERLNTFTLEASLQMGRRALERARRLYTGKAYLAGLLDVYDAARVGRGASR